MTPQSVLLFTIATALCSLFSSAVIIDLGSCADFAIEAGTAVSFNGVLTTVKTGSVGISPGDAVTGNYKLDDGTTQINTPASIQCASDHKTAYDAASGATCPPSNMVADLAGQTLIPGVYCSGALDFSASTLTLDGQGNPNAQWIFQSASTLTTATATSFILQNGAQASNVFWAIGTGASLGYSSSFVGTILAQTAITIGTTGDVNGRLLAFTAVTFAGGSTVTLPSSSSPSVGVILTSNVRTNLRASKPKGSPRPNTSTFPLGSCESFALMAGSAVTFNGDKTTVTTGSVGVSPGTFVGGNYQVLAGTVEINTASANSCAADRTTAYNALTAAVCPTGNTVNELAGLTLSPGVYCSATAIKLSASSVTLDGRGDPNAQWIFQAGSTLSAASSTKVILTNGANAANVFWAVGSSASMGLSSSFQGTVIAYASISYDVSATITGRSLAGAGLTFASGSTVTLPN